MHFTARDLMQLSVKPAGVLCGASCHDAKELAKAAQLALDYVLLSPVQSTASHPDGDTLGWSGFSNLIQDYPLPVYAYWLEAMARMDWPCNATVGFNDWIEWRALMAGCWGIFNAGFDVLFD
jgi:8-oxo-dGTP diphosphatase